MTSQLKTSEWMTSFVQAPGYFYVVFRNNLGNVVSQDVPRCLPTIYPSVSRWNRRAQELLQTYLQFSVPYIGFPTRMTWCFMNWTFHLSHCDVVHLKNGLITGKTVNNSWKCYLFKWHSANIQNTQWWVWSYFEGMGKGYQIENYCYWPTLHCHVVYNNINLWKSAYFLLCLTSLNLATKT